MAYIDCPCCGCTERTTGAKRVACHPGCERFATWKTKQQKAMEKQKKDKPYHSETMFKFAKRKMMNRKAGR